MPVASVEDLLVEELRLVYNAEKQLQRALPRLAKRVRNERLRDALNHRRDESNSLVEDLDQALEGMGKSRGRSKNEAIEGLLELGNRLQEEIEDPEVLDVALLGHVQKVEHYCIGAWGTAAALGRSLGHEDVVRAMEHALDEGKRFDQELTELAETEVNRTALETADEDDDDEEDDEPRTRGGGRQSARGASGQAGENRARAPTASRPRAEPRSGGRAQSNGQTEARNRRGRD